MKVLQNKRLENIVIYDIETIRIEDELKEDSIEYPAFSYKMRFAQEAEKFQADHKTLEELWKEKASLYGETCRIVCISVGRFSEGEFKVKSYWGDDEVKILTDFTNDIDTMKRKIPQLCLCGHSSTGFDAPTIVKRCIINQLPIPEVLNTSSLRPWEIENIDIATLWKGNSFYTTSLLGMATALGIKSSKEGMKGSDTSQEYYEHRNLEGIKDYCERDTICTYEILKKMMYIK